MSPTAGVVCLAKPGDVVERGQPLLELHTDDPARFESAIDALDSAIENGATPVEPPALVVEHITA